MQVPGGLAFSEFRGYEDWQAIAVSHNGDKLATILGNPTMIEAYKAGIPGNGKPFPDGARMAKIHWTAKKAEDQPGEPTVPGALHDMDFMVKDGKRFADSGGWGWAAFEYDPASETFRPGETNDCRRRSTTPSAASPATRSCRTRITSSPPTRSGEGARGGGGRRGRDKERAMPQGHEPGQSAFRSVLPEDIDWKPFPAFPPSVRLAVVVGDPSRPAPYLIRVKVPPA